MKTILLDGQELNITLASFEDAYALQSAVMECLKKVTINLDGLDLKAVADDIGNSDAQGVIDLLLKSFLNLLTSKEVKACLFTCAKSCSFGIGAAKVIVTQDIFSPEDMRGFYIPIMKEILMANVAPFFSRLGSLFGNLGVKLPGFLGQK